MQRSLYDANAIEHRLIKPNHPWTNGQAERLNRTIKRATVKRYYYDSHNQFRTYFRDFMAAYNYGYMLKPLDGLAPECPSSEFLAPKAA